MAGSGADAARPRGPEFFGPKLAREALEFEGVTFRVFPLRANPYRLERFCEDYLNRELPEAIGHFRPAMPYVLLEIINYGRMSPKASNLGWVSQNEVVFAVPLERYRKQDGRWAFVDWATVSPFIFVDDDMSTAEGREIYGWPKVFSAIEAEADPWMEDPRSRRRLLTLKTQMFSELFAGRRLEMLPLLQVEQRLPEAASQWMPDLSYLARPLLGPSSALMQGVGTLADFALAAADRWREVGDPGAGPLSEALRRGLRFGPQDLYGNTINLKQFRADVPRKACYQALVNARFTFKNFHAGGPLGDIELMRGDLSGGFRIRIHRHPAYPIIENLGLEVFSEERGRGQPISLLRPQLPFWFQADTRYEMGETIAWRIESKDWLTREDELAKRAAERSGKLGEVPPTEIDGVTMATPGVYLLPGKCDRDEDDPKPAYNTSLGPVIAPVQEPFDFWDATMHVIALQADARVLKDFVEKRLDLPDEVGEVWLDLPRLCFEVIDEDKRPLADVVLVLEPEPESEAEGAPGARPATPRRDPGAGRALPEPKRTSSDGEAVFEDPDLGRERDVWQLTASLEGFQKVERRVSIRGSMGKPVEIVMIREPPAIPEPEGQPKPEKPRELRFKAIDDSGPLAGVAFLLENTKKKLHRVSGEDGHAAFKEPQLDSDVWRLTVDSPGFSPFQRRVDVRELRETLEIELRAQIEEVVVVKGDGDADENTVPVILKVSNYGEMSSAANDIGRWAEREVGLAIPVWFKPRGAAQPMPVIFWAWVFSDSPIAVRTDREVSGLPTVQAKIAGGLDRWSEAPADERRLLSVSVGAFPALHVGAGREQRVLLRVEGNPPGPDFYEQAGRREGHDEHDEHDEYEQSGGECGLELDQLAIKQFRDAEHPTEACYQAVVAARTFIGSWHKENSRARVTPDPTAYRVFVHEYETHPLVRELGLRVKPTELAQDGTRVAEVKPYLFEEWSDEMNDEPVHALSMRVDLRQHLSRTLCWRGFGFADQWQVEKKGVEYVRKRAESHEESIRTLGRFFEELRFSIHGRFGLPEH